MSFCKDDYVVVTEDGVAILTKIIEINDDYFKLEGFTDQIHNSKISEIELAYPVFKCSTIDQLVESSECHGKLTNKIYKCLENREKFDGKIIVSCPWCDGTGEDGNDREVPPNSYVCQICDGSGKVKIKPYGTREKKYHQEVIEGEEKYVTFEKKHGAISMLKVMMSSLNQLLASKNLINADELKEFFEEEMEIFEDN